MKKTRYRQCKLEKRTFSGIVETISWIPEKFAEVGRILKLKTENDVWVDGWVVHSVSSSFMNEDEAPDIHKAIREHRKNTGDSLPKNKQEE